MPVLSLPEAEARCAHAKSEEAWKITEEMLGVTNESQTFVTTVRVIYTDLDYNEIELLFERATDARQYIMFVETVWQLIHCGSTSEEIDKVSFYREALALMREKVDEYGTLLPCDVKTALNEIEAYLNMEITVW